MKQFLLFAYSLLLCIAANLSFAQWSPVKPIYGGALMGNDGAASFVIGGKGYVLAGSSTDKWYEYDIAADKWTDKGSVPAEMGKAFSMAIVLNGKAYIVGGDTAGVPTASVWMFDPAASNPWTKKNDFPGGVRDAGIGFVVNNTGYVGCGFDGTNLHGEVWKYDPGTDNWTMLANSIPAGLLFPSSFVIGNKAYVIGGGTPPSGVTETNQVWEFDAAKENWTSVTSFPGTNRQAAVAFSNGIFGYYGGGMSGFSNNYYDMWRFEPVLKEWKKVEDVPLLGASWASVFTSGNTAYVGIGAQLTSTGLTGDDKFFKYDMPSTNDIKKIGANMAVTAYPNPATDKIFVKGLEEQANLDLYNAQGRKVRTATYGDHTLDVASLPPGVYLLRVSTGDASASFYITKE